MAIAEQLVTVDEYAKLPKRPDGWYELLNGEVVKVTYPKVKQRRIQNWISRLWDAHLGESGTVRTEFPFRPEPEHQLWAADVGFARAGRLGPDDDSYLSGAPDIVAQVLSPSNTPSELLDGQGVCLRNRCRAFWVVDPDKKRVYVYWPDQPPAVFGSGEHVPLGPISDASVAVNDIFADNT